MYFWNWHSKVSITTIKAIYERKMRSSHKNIEISLPSTKFQFLDTTDVTKKVPPWSDNWISFNGSLSRSVFCISLNLIIWHIHPPKFFKFRRFVANENSSLHAWDKTALCGSRWRQKWTNSVAFAEKLMDFFWDVRGYILIDPLKEG